LNVPCRSLLPEGIATFSDGESLRQCRPAGRTSYISATRCAPCLVQKIAADIRRPH
jgi:hypothetical protein